MSWISLRKMVRVPACSAMLLAHSGYLSELIRICHDHSLVSGSEVLNLPFPDFDISLSVRLTSTSLYENMLCLLLATFYCLMAAALPARPVFCPIEESPWTISNIVVFTSNISGSDVLKNSVGTGMGMGMTGDTTFSTESFIDFTFCDANEGLHLEVECSRITNGTISDEINFYPCDRQGVVFQYYGRTLEIQRAYKSPWSVMTQLVQSQDTKY